MDNNDREAIASTAKLLNLNPSDYAMFLALCERLYASGKLAGAKDMGEAVLGEGVFNGK